MRIKRMISLLLAVMLLLSIVLVPAAAKGEKTGLEDIRTYKPKAITVVYDDSGSMVNGDNKNPADKSGYIDRWAQAKYALEVFVSILNDEDVLDVFVMSNTGKKVRYSIQGQDREAAVEIIHSGFKTGDFQVETPIGTVDNAFTSLKSKSNKYEKWFIVLTDGAFNENGQANRKLPPEKTKSILNHYSHQINRYNDQKYHLIYIPIEVDPNYKIDGGDFDVLEVDKTHSICQRLLEASAKVYADRDSVKNFSKSLNRIDTNGVSLKQVILFLQGEDVEVQSVSGGKISKSVEVVYTEPSVAINYRKDKGPTFKGHEDYIKTNTSLKGKVLIVEPKDGKYLQPDKEGGIQINYASKDKLPSANSVAYFVPAVELQYSLSAVDNSGKPTQVWLSSDDIGAKTSLTPGDYLLKADIVDSATKKSVSNKALVNPDKSNPAKLDITVMGNTYHLGELKKGVVIHLEGGDSIFDTLAQSSILGGKYYFSLKPFENAIVKKTYSFVVNIEAPQSKKRLDFTFLDVEYLIGDLKKIKDTDYDKMFKATVSCYTDKGEKIAIDNEIWQQLIKGYDAAGSTISPDSPISILTLETENEKHKTNIGAYDVFFKDESVNENGEGVFYIKPNYALDKKGREDAKHTTHRNFGNTKLFKKIGPVCHFKVEVNLPDATETIAYSTAPTPVEQKSAQYIISISVWWAWLIIAIIILAFCYCLKGKLPRHLNGYAYMTKKQEWDLERDRFVDKKINPRTDVKRIKCKRTFLSCIWPFCREHANIRIDKSYFPTLKIKAKNRFFRSSDVILCNHPKDFERMSESEELKVGSRFISYSENMLTTETVKEKKKRKKGFVLSRLNTGIFGFGWKTQTKAAWYELTLNGKKRKRGEDE